MCDYSLMMVPNRLAAEGEELAAHRFQSGTTGFVACSSFTIWRAEQDQKNLWRRLKDWFASVGEPAPVVCIPPGARLLVERGRSASRRRPNPDSADLATFTQLSAEANQHRDALRFDDGTTVTLGMLAEGQRIKVLRLSPAEEPEAVPEPALQTQPV